MSAEEVQHHILLTTDKEGHSCPTGDGGKLEFDNQGCCVVVQCDKHPQHFRRATDEEEVVARARHQ